MLFLFTQCKKEEKHEEIVLAQVEQVKLTEENYQSYIGYGNDGTRDKNEYIKRWIETELLVQRSHDLNLLDKENYYLKIEESKKELAATIAINDYLKKKNLTYLDKDLKKYFNLNKDDYRVAEESFVLNLATFDDEKKAIEFRNSALSDGWNKALKKFETENSLIDSKLEKTYKLSEIQSKRIIRVLKKLFKKEISLVVKTELNNFIVVQEIDKMRKNEIPKYKYVRDNVLRTFQLLQQREIINHFIDSLKTQKNVKIF